MAAGAFESTPTTAAPATAAPATTAPVATTIRDYTGGGGSRTRKDRAGGDRPAATTPAEQRSGSHRRQAPAHSHRRRRHCHFPRRPRLGSCQRKPPPCSHQRPVVPPATTAPVPTAQVAAAASGDRTRGDSISVYAGDAPRSQMQRQHRCSFQQRRLGQTRNEGHLTRGWTGLDAYILAVSVNDRGRGLSRRSGARVVALR